MPDNQDEFNISYHNYDTIFTNSFSVFKNKVIDFLGVDLPRIDSFVETKFAEIETSKQRLDLNFRLEDGSILHLEEEADISKNDLIRFAAYDLKLYNRYRDPIRTVILCINGFEDSKATFNTGSMAYKTIVVDMSDRDGDSVYEEIQRKIEAGEEVNVLELIFLPLMKSKEGMVKRVKKAIDLEQKLGYGEVMTSRVIAMTLVLSNKFLEEKEVKEIWRDYNMLKIFKVAQEEGKKEGKIEQLQETVFKLLTKKIGKLPKKYKESLKDLEKEELEIIRDDIFDIEKLEDIDKYFN
ncbi:DUF4351 domain-containing protein [Fuchsiella alkaliacetigena]|uniref:DUF4351 domain-containing protein n=1 Tax=Fuchsiella alkaliacetigena TaxID=957042 RepID=UPI00200ABA5A|nr:DUF4351 domain-containing protein [Fuchsiella alkaliacetigena]MCK8824103.1 DUF4351 domain-containing protein [Fuchsiella alkaliacetigena]